MNLSNQMPNIKLRTKLIVALLGMGLIPFAITAYFMFSKMSNTLESNAFNQLESLRTNKAEQVEEYFLSIQNQITSYANSTMIVDAMNMFSYSFAHSAEINLSDENVQKFSDKLTEFYSSEFVKEFRSRNDKSINIGKLIPKNYPSIYHQYQYIANSQYPLGEKDKLDKANDTNLYNDTHAKYHPIIKDFLDKFGYYDIFLVEPENGYIVYSVYKELDYATSLETGPYSDSGIGRAYRHAKNLSQSNSFHLEDFTHYLPSYNAPASFISSPIINNNELQGVLIFQMPVDKINSMMSNTVGLGESGQTYLIGDDLLMRNQSRLTNENTLLEQVVSTDSAKKVISGEVGIGTINGYQDNLVLSSFAPLNIIGLNWSILAEIDKKEAFSSLDKISKILAMQAIVVISIVIGLAFLIARNVIKILGADPNDLLKIANDIINGRLENDYCTSKKRTGVFDAMINMQDTLRESIQSEAKKNRLTERLKQALDNVSTIVLVADNDHNIIYTNNLATKFFVDIESEIRTELPSFDAKKIVGTNIDSFHKNPVHQRMMIEKLDSIHTTDLEFAGRSVRINVSPIVSNNNRLGTVLQWTDLTAERMIEGQVQDLVNSSLEGDLSQRLDLSNKNGFLLRLSEGINNMLDVSENMINDTIRVINAVSQGNLNEKINSDYKGTFNQLKTDVNNTIEKLTEIVKSIRESSVQVSSAAEEISHGNYDLSRRTESQAASLEETSASMEEMTSSVKNNAENSQEANKLSIKSQDHAQKGGEIVQNAVAAMDKINTSSNKIAEIISVIDEIAFQTNLLALNAAVEAARAGDQGRGFAVVASEVRNLAGRSATAAKEIKELIQDSVTKVHEGSRLVNESGKTLEEIILGIKQMTTLVGDITNASSEQAKGIEQVNLAISNIDETTQSNAALVEQAAAAAESMSEQSKELIRQVSFFNYDEEIPEEKIFSDMSIMKEDSLSVHKSTDTKKVIGSDIDNSWEEF